jgi:hypothetical protein
MHISILTFQVLQLGSFQLYCIGLYIPLHAKANSLLPAKKFQREAEERISTYQDVQPAKEVSARIRTMALAIY